MVEHILNVFYVPLIGDSAVVIDLAQGGGAEVPTNCREVPTPTIAEMWPFGPEANGTTFKLLATLITPGSG